MQTALQNPQPDVLTPHEVQEQAPREFVPAGQIPLYTERGVGSRLRARIADLWAKAHRREQELELMPFWRNVAAPFALVTSLATTAGLFIAGLIVIGRVGPTIPFLYNPTLEHWETAIDKSILLLVPVALFVIEGLTLRVIYAVFVYDRRLSTMLSWTLTVVNIMILIAATEIYSLSVGVPA